MLHVARCTLFHCVKERTKYDKNAALNCLRNYPKGTADMTTPHCSGGQFDTRLHSLNCTKTQAEQDCCSGLPLRYYTQYNTACWTSRMSLQTGKLCTVDL